MADSTVSILPWYQIAEPYLLMVFGTLFSALLTWLCAQFQTRTGIRVSDKAKADIQQAAQNAAGRILAAQEGPVAHLSFDVRSPMVASEVKKLQTSVPDAISKLGMNPDRVADVIVAKIGLAQAAAPSAAVMPAIVNTTAPVVIPGGN